MVMPEDSLCLSNGVVDSCYLEVPEITLEFSLFSFKFEVLGSDFYDPG